MITLLDKPAPLYAVGKVLQITRNAWSREVITATVERARLTDCGGYLYTLQIDKGQKYGHWRVVFEHAVTRSIVSSPLKVAA